MRRIDQVKNKKMRNVKYIEVLDKNTLKIDVITRISNTKEGS